MIYCILTTGGYVESAQIATIMWCTDPSLVIPAQAETAEDALKSLANDLLMEYLEEWMRDHFEPEEFSAWVYDLVKMDSCNDGFRRYGKAAAPGPDHWWPYVNLSTFRSFDVDQILNIPENFEILATMAIDPLLIKDKEGRKHLIQYQKEYDVTYKQDEDGYWVAELEYK